MNILELNNVNNNVTLISNNKTVFCDNIIYINELEDGMYDIKCSKYYVTMEFEDGYLYLIITNNDYDIIYKFHAKFKIIY